MRDDAGSLTGEPELRFYDSLIPSHKSKAPGSPAVGALSAGEPLPTLVLQVLGELGLTQQTFEAASQRARSNATDLGWELVCAGEVSENALTAAMGKALGIAVAASADPDSIVCDGAGTTPQGGCLTLPDMRGQRTLRVCGRDLQGRLLIAPRLEDLNAMQALLALHPDRSGSLCMASSRVLCQHIDAASLARRAEAARLSLEADRPELSARTVWTGGQGFVAGTIALALLQMVLTDAYLLLTVLHLAVLPLFLFCTLTRLLAAGHLLRRKHSSRGTQAAATAPSDPAIPHPVYSVLVPLYDEAEMVAGLVASLSAFQWPASRLEIMLVCEADDLQTIDAARTAIVDKPHFTLVLVPPALPRTKPKALNVALPLATGDFVVLYDAEDRPQPDQLEAAWRRVRGDDDSLACLQAPLVIRNGANSWLSGHFALEYAALFRGFLPWLVAKGLPLPLSGTSNHFRALM